MLEATASTEPKVNKQYGKGNLKEKRSTEQGKQRLSNERGMKTQLRENDKNNEETRTDEIGEETRERGN